jgi:hypothetical protein
MYVLLLLSVVLDLSVDEEEADEVPELLVLEP